MLCRSHPSQMWFFRSCLLWRQSVIYSVLHYRTLYNCKRYSVYYQIWPLEVWKQQIWQFPRKSVVHQCLVDWPIDSSTNCFSLPTLPHHLSSLHQCISVHICATLTVCVSISPALRHSHLQVYTQIKSTFYMNLFFEGRSLERPVVVIWEYKVECTSDNGMCAYVCVWLLCIDTDFSADKICALQCIT